MYEWHFGPGVDLELLADYAGGALDGTPEAATVERLIAEEPAWAQAYMELRSALDAVQVDLRLLAAAERDEEMPADVMRGLDAALALAAPDRRGKLIEFVPRQRRSPRSWSPRSWSRQGGSRRWQAPVAAAAAAVIFGVGGTALVGELTGPDADRATTAKLGAQADKAIPGPRDMAGEAPGAVSARSSTGQPFPVIATGTDYGPANITQFGKGATIGQARKAEADGTKPDQVMPQPGTRASASSPLDRLTDPAAMSACLAAIKSEHAQPTSVSVVDLARYEGAPAVIVALADADGARWVWVAGPECGVAGAHTLLRTRAG